MKKGLTVVCLAIGLVIYWSYFLGNELGEGPSPVKESPLPVEELVDPKITVLVDSPFARKFGKLEMSQERELELVQDAFRDYLEFVKSSYRRPIGNNRDFVAQLTGGNIYMIAPIPPRHSRINSEGELTDQNGVPLAIHPIAGDAIEVRSAGPDGQLWTEDDLVCLTSSGREIREAVLESEAVEAGD